MSVEVKGGLLGNSLLKKSFSDSQALLYKISLASLFQFCEILGFNISYGHVNKNGCHGRHIENL